MDDKELNKYKKASKIHNVNNYKESKTVKYRKNNKQSIDVKYEKVLRSADEVDTHFKKHGIKNNNGSYTINGNTQLIESYKNKLYQILEVIGVPSDPSVKYKADGKRLGLDSDEEGYLLGPYLMTDKFSNIPNVNRIGWLLIRFYNIEIDLQKGNLKAIVNSLLLIIKEYSEIILISIEGDIVPHSTNAATIEKINAKEERIKKAHQLADEIKKDFPNIKAKSEIARRITNKTDWSYDTVRQKYLADYQI